MSSPNATVLLGPAQLDLKASPTAAERVQEGQPVSLRAAGFLPSSPLLFTIGDRSVDLRTDARGCVQWERDDALLGVAGRVDLHLAAPDLPALGAIIEVVPTRMTQAGLDALLADLDRMVPGIAGALGGVATGTTSSLPERSLQQLERSLGAVGSAVPWVARSPSVHRRERATAAPSRTGPASANDARWVARHPVHATRVRQRGAEVAVRREVHEDADTLENQGVMALLRKMQGIAEDLARLLSTERQRIELSRTAREAFTTRRSNLFQEMDQPRLDAIRRRTERLEALHRQLSALPAKMRLPPGLHSASFVRTPRVESHPGYWRLFQVWQQLRELEVGSPPPGIAPIDGLDRLYELWCALALRESLQASTGQAEGASLVLNDEAWFATLAPHTELLRFEKRDRSVCLIYEPAYAYRNPDAEVGKLVPGQPWRPDLVIELRAAGVLVELHVLDAKHRLERQHLHDVPWEAMNEVWLKYTDTIGRPKTLEPLVASTWILYPGSDGQISPRSPAMLTDTWPAGRPRGGAIALHPQEGAEHPHLQRLLSVLLKGWT